MKLVLLALSLALAGGAAFAQAPAPSAAPAPTMKAPLCNTCGRVTSVHQEKRRGQGGAAGVVGGAVVGGLLGNQVGKGGGRALATVGGAAAGAYVGNEVQKKVTSKRVWVTRVAMKDGTVRTFEQQAQPPWQAGSVVRVNGNNRLVLN